ncbi:hypothetical protein CEE62_17535, partial [Stenotrophomonas maltophilia]
MLDCSSQDAPSTTLLHRRHPASRLGILRIPGGCDAGRSLLWRGPPHCGATAIPAVKERPMTPPPRRIRPQASHL